MAPKPSLSLCLSNLTKRNRARLNGSSSQICTAETAGAFRCKSAFAGSGAWERERERKVWCSAHSWRRGWPPHTTTTRSHSACAPRPSLESARPAQHAPASASYAPVSSRPNLPCAAARSAAGPLLMPRSSSARQPGRSLRASKLGWPVPFPAQRAQQQEQQSARATATPLAARPCTAACASARRPGSRPTRDCRAG
eukprot:356661-Chlamydomonas_euryale.AAC.2